MLDFYQKRKLRSISHSRVTQGLLVAVALVIFWNAYERFTIASMMGERRELIEQEAATLEARKASLEAEVEYLRDERGIESAMRRQFDIALPGEEVVVILEDDEGEVYEPLATTTSSESGWWPW